MNNYLIVSLLLTISIGHYYCGLFAQQTMSKEAILSTQKSVINREIQKFLKTTNDPQKIDSFFNNLAARYRHIISKSCSKIMIPKGSEIIAEYPNPRYIDSLPVAEHSCYVYFFATDKSLQLQSESDYLYN